MRTDNNARLLRGDGHRVGRPALGQRTGPTEDELKLFAEAFLSAWDQGFAVGYRSGVVDGRDSALVAVAADAAQLKPDHIVRAELLERDRVAERLAEFDRCADVYRSACRRIARANRLHDLSVILSLPDEPRFQALRVRAQADRERLLGAALAEDSSGEAA